ncbi:MAG: hypothetical protein OEL81_09075 [Nitrosopumilus sp.]|nr:hypothetical protein [Nitrosopumilus sp.]
MSSLQHLIPCIHQDRETKPIVIEFDGQRYPKLLDCKECHDLIKSLTNVKIISEEEFK